jgi:very-short-patch-repair endonuclease
MKYSVPIVIAWFKAHGIDVVPEYRFHARRKWRFDFAVLSAKVAIEVQGGIFTQGRHTRGAALLKEMEKLNHAAAAGWRVLYSTPDNLCMTETIELVKEAVAR